MSEDRKQTSIADRETHTVLAQDLEVSVLIKSSNHSHAYTVKKIRFTYAPKSCDVASGTLSVVEFAETGPSPNQVSLTCATRPRWWGLSRGVLEAKTIN